MNSFTCWGTRCASFAPNGSATTTILDPLQGTEEARAVSLVNLAESQCDFFTLPEVLGSIDIHL